MSLALIKWWRAACALKPLRSVGSPGQRPWREWPTDIGDDPISGDDIEQARQRLIDRWDHFTIVEVSQRLVETAGRFADVFSLRGYDSVQLAAGHELHSNSDQSVLFACYDRRLNQAAQLLQLEVLP